MDPYADLDYAESYFGQRLHTRAWTAASVSDRTKALTMATRDIDRLDYADEKADSDQEREFPRGEDDEVPDDIKIACCEIALARLDGVVPETELENAMVSSQSFSGVRTTYDRTAVPEHIVAMIASARAWTYLKPYLREAGTIKLSRVS
jgi:hypothetical protein